MTPSQAAQQIFNVSLKPNPHQSWRKFLSEKSECVIRICLHGWLSDKKEFYGFSFRSWFVN